MDKATVERNDMKTGKRLDYVCSPDGYWIDPNESNESLGYVWAADGYWFDSNKYGGVSGEHPKYPLASSVGNRGLIPKRNGHDKPTTGESDGYDKD